MKRSIALIWLLTVIAAGTFVVISSWRGIKVETDLLSLLPTETHDHEFQPVAGQVSQDLSRRLLFLVGHQDRLVVRQAAKTIRSRLEESGLFEAARDIPGPDTRRRMAEVYFSHRSGLLAEGDRQALEIGEGRRLVDRARAQTYGVGGYAGGRLLATDPFMLFPAFLADLPIPTGRMSLDDGLLGIDDGLTSWVLIAGAVTGDPYSLAFQDQFLAAYSDAVTEANRLVPEVRLLRAGVLFYAYAGSKEALHDTSIIGLASLVGSLMLVLAVFQSLGPALFSLGSILVGLICALATTLAWFGKLHVSTLLFGASLIGVSVDYSLHYYSQRFGEQADPEQRISKILPGLLLGLATSVMGYGALALAPLPGFHQVAVFSTVGLVASFITVLLWGPLLDRAPAQPMGVLPRRIMTIIWLFWERRNLLPWRRAILGSILFIALIGATKLTSDDDVRHQQRLDRMLTIEQSEVRRLIGYSYAGQFFLVRAANREAALVAEEALAERLESIVEHGGLTGWLSPARFVPSLERQRTNAALVAHALELPYLFAWRAELGLPDSPVGSRIKRYLLPNDLVSTGALPILAELILDEGIHVVRLEGAADIPALRAAAVGLSEIRFIDPTGDISILLSLYRQRAVILLIGSVLLILPVLIWRYGWRGGLAVLAPPMLAICLTPPLLALVGIPFTFFSAMALVLVLAVGIDYAIFCAETDGHRDPVTLLAITLAAATTLLSFGLLAASEVAGVSSFGTSMLVGIILSFLLAPLAARAYLKRR